MYMVRRTLLTLSATVAILGTAQAQQSNPVTSNPPPDAVGRDSETSPGTPNRQNSAPGYRRSYYGQSYTYGPSYNDPYYGDSYYSDPPSIIVTPTPQYLDVD